MWIKIGKIHLNLDQVITIEETEDEGYDITLPNGKVIYTEVSKSKIDRFLFLRYREQDQQLSEND